MLSWWEETALLDHDVAVVGGGLVGLSTACALLERRPTLRVLVLERGVLPSGASTRNAGFACYGSASEILSDVDAEGPERAQTLVAERWLGLARLRERVGDEAMGYEEVPGYDLLGPGQEAVLDRLGEVNRLLRPVLGFDAFARDEAALARFGFPRDRVTALVRSHGEGALHPGRLMRALLGRAQRLGAQVLSGVAVEALEEAPDGARLVVTRDAPRERFAFRAALALVTTNAFARDLLPALDVVPGRGQVLVTAEVPGGHPLRGTFHRDQGDLYFRDLGSRVLLGGGRHTDVAGETTTTLQTTEPIQAYLERFLSEVVLPGRPVAIERRWAGIMAFGRERAPIVRRVSPHVAVGVRMSGMGVALGSRVADRLADHTVSDTPRS
jgi:glycine/D-amino acid oxidase-like deaminating enzyme